MPELAATGADFVSVGALTHSAPAIDISFEIEPALIGSPRADACRPSSPTRSTRARPRSAASRRRVAVFLDDRIDQRRRGARWRRAATREGAVVIADAQTAGRGRRGRTWFSPPGSGLYVSVVLAPGARARDPTRATTLLTLAAGVALAEGIERGDRPARRSQVAERSAGRRAASSPAFSPKASGTAIDAIVVLGYGINVARDGVSAGAARPRHVARVGARTARSIARSCSPRRSPRSSRRYDDLLAGRFDAILDAWRRRAPAAVGARVTWTTPAGSQSGMTAGIDDHGALLVRVGDRVERHRLRRSQWSDGRVYRVDCLCC